MPETTSELSPPANPITGGKVQVESPSVFTGPLRDAHHKALTERVPIFAPLNTYADDRGWSLMNMMTGVLNEQGQINFSVQYPGVIKAWHRHEKQTDFWMCAHGHIKAGIYRDDDNTAWMQVLGEQRPGVLIIPPHLWHGAATVGPESAGLLYYVTRAYNPHQPDEQRRSFDSIRGFPWGIRHG